MLLRLLIILLISLSLPVKALVVLQYHHISDKTPRSTSISPELFKQHLDYIKDNQFKVITLQTFVDSVKQQRNFEDKTVLITFDDGYRSIFDEAFPLLKEKGFPFTVFVNTQPIGQNLSQFMSWSELQVLSEHKGTIANHSVTHPHLIRQLDNESEHDRQTRITVEVLQAQSLIEKQIGTALSVFAYPFGEYDSGIRALLKKLGFIAFGQHSGAVSLLNDMQSVPRFAFGGDYGDMEDFKMKINSLPMPIVSIELLDHRHQVLADHVLPVDVNQPAIAIELAAKFASLELSCFASGQGKQERLIKGSKQIFQAKQALPIGRSRFNCTAPSAERGRYYWFAQPWIRRNNDGSWYSE